MRTNVTLSADDVLIQRAREKAMREYLTLNALFRQWLRSYVGQTGRPAAFRDLLASLAYADAGRSFTRDELNER